MYEIYLITNQINEKRYVGQTRQGYLTRFKQHSKAAEKGKYKYLLYYAMQKYGVRYFSICLLSFAPTQEEANRKEKMWISILDSTDPNKGYNLTAGGNEIVLVSEESKAKKSMSHKAFLSNPENHPCFRHDVSTKNILSLFDKGKTKREIADLLGIAFHLVYDRLRKSGADTKKVTDAFTKEVMNLYPLGFSGVSIAKKLNCSLTKVYNCLKNNSIEIRSKGIRQLPAILETKKCIGCKSTKPLDDFHKNKNRRDGRRNLCKTCVSSYDRKHHAKAVAALLPSCG